MPKIEIWGSKYCESCQKVKDLVTQSHPEEYGVDLVETDVTGAPDWQGKPVPVLSIDGKTIDGYKPGDIQAAIESLYAELSKGSDVTEPVVPEPEEPPAPGNTPVNIQSIDANKALSFFCIGAFVGFVFCRSVATRRQHAQKESFFQRNGKAREPLRKREDPLGHGF